MKRLPLLLVSLLLLAAVAGLYLAGRETVPPGNLGLRLDAGGVPAGEVSAGTSWRWPGRGRLLLFPAAPETLLFPSPAGTGNYRLFDAGGEEVTTRFAVLFHVLPGEAAGVYEQVDGDGTALAETLLARLRDTARPLASTFPSSSFTADGGRAFAGRLRDAIELPGVEVSVEPVGAAGPGAGVSVLVVGVDAGDWRLIDPLLAAGRLPHLAGLLDRGVRADLHTFTPMLSPLLWTTIATGTTADRHGILDFLTPDPATGKMVPVSSTLRREPALWNYLTQYGVSQAVVAWLATWPAETVSGHLVSDRLGFLAFAGPTGTTGDEGMTWPPEYVERARELEVDPASLPPEFWQRFFDLPAERLSGLGRGGYHKGDLLQNFALTVGTALSTTAIAEDLQRSGSPRFTAVYYELIDAAGHLLMPYAPPRAPGISEEDYLRYHGAMDATYVLQDELLGRLLAGVDTTRTLVMVLSDHGMKSGDERPVGSAEIEGGEAARWHRDPGILALAGPGVREGVVLEEEPSLLDIAPTLLSILGIPVPDSLPGRFLTEAFTEEGRERYAPARVDSFPFRPEVWTPPRLPEGGAKGGPATAALHNNLGLVLEQKGDLAGAEAEYRLALEAVPRDENARNNLASVLIKLAQFGEAERILLELRREDPSAVPPAYNLGLLYMQTNHLPQAEQAYRAVLALEPGHLKARIDLGHVLVRERRSQEAAAIFQQVLAEYPAAVNAHFGLGLAAAQMGDMERAKEEFRRTLALDPNHASAKRNLRQMGG